VNVDEFRPNRTFRILGGWDLESMDADLSAFDNILPEDEVRSDRSNFAISIALGRRHRPWLRSESEIAVRDFGFNSLLSSDDGSTITVDRSLDTRVFSLMRNAVLQWNNSSRFTPYGGMGIGVSYVDFEEEFSVSESDRPDSGDRLALISGDDTVFTWQAIGGVATRIGENANFITEYRYFATADVVLDDGFLGINRGVFDAQNLFFGLTTVDF